MVNKLADGGDLGEVKREGSANGEAFDGGSVKGVAARAGGVRDVLNDRSVAASQVALDLRDGDDSLDDLRSDDGLGAVALVREDALTRDRCGREANDRSLSDGGDDRRGLDHRRKAGFRGVVGKDDRVGSGSVGSLLDDLSVVESLRERLGSADGLGVDRFFADRLSSDDFEVAAVLEKRKKILLERRFSVASRGRRLFNRVPTTDNCAEHAATHMKIAMTFPIMFFQFCSFSNVLFRICATFL